MNLLSAEKLTRIANDEKVLFRDLNFGIADGQKLALVGVNGCGKSTLMKTLAGLEPPDAGLVSVRKGIRVEYLQQDPQFDPYLTVIESALQTPNPAAQALRQYEKLLLEGRTSGAAFEDAMSEMERLHAWDLEARVKQILGRLGIQQFGQKTRELSGGQKKRLALAALLISSPDLILLDEPTNHLDLEMVEWLEEFLRNFSGAILMVTHDRYFLDRVATGIVELDGGKIFTYDGNYEYFLLKKEERETVERVTADKARNLLRTELEWLRRQPKARTTKSQARIDAISGLKERATGPEEKQKLKLEVKTARLGNTILEMEAVNHAFGDKKILEDFTYVFKKKDRIGIIGPNGVGKTTFLEIATGGLHPDAGVITIGQNTVFGYYRQMEMTWKPGQKAIDVVKEVAENFTLASGETISASRFMDMFLFPPGLQYTLVEKLSGGEKRRLALLRVLVKNPNFLILDEPTNDLDLVTLNALEDFLYHFPGVLLIVSHDRYFMDKLVDHLFVFEGKGVILDYPGNYSDYRHWKVQKEAETQKQETVKDKPANEVTEPTAVREKKKLSFKEQREYETLSADLERLEKRKSELEEALNAGGTDYQQLDTLGRELEQVKRDLESKGDRWLELSEYL